MRIKAYLITKEGFSKVMDLDRLTPIIRVAKVSNLSVGVWEQVPSEVITAMQFHLEEHTEYYDVTIGIYRET